MSNSSLNQSQAALIENREFMRSLARSLVLDEHKADDLVQQACLALLERPPARTGSLRSWLARVVQNLAFSMLTRDRDRVWRESVAASARPLSDITVAVETEEHALEQQQLLVDVLRCLRQPYRTTLYLRYYRDLSPSQIAQEESISVATVKTRLRRGLELLRGELDRTSSSGRGSWCLAMAPIAAPQNVFQFQSALQASTLLKGTLLMKKSALAVITVVVLGGAATYALRSLNQRGGEQPQQTSMVEPLTATNERDTTPLAESQRAGGNKQEEAKRARTQLATGEPGLAAASSSSNMLRGRVVDDTGRPVSGAEISLINGAQGFSLLMGMGWSGAGPESLGLPRAARMTTDSAGRFELPLAEAGAKHLAIGADFFAPYRKEFIAEEGRDVELGELRLDPGAMLSGRVVDSSGRGIEGATLHRTPTGANAGFMVLESPSSSHAGGSHTGPDGAVAVTDSRGAFEIRRLAVGPWSLRVRSDEHPSANIHGQTQRAGQRVADLLVTLDDGFEISGRVSGLPAVLDDGLLVTATPRLESSDGGILTGMPAFLSTSAEVEADGAFKLRGLLGDRDYNVRAVSAGSPFSRKKRSEVQVARPGERGVRLAYATPAALVFQAVDAASGEPITEFDVRAGDFPLELSGLGNLGGHHPEGRIRIEDFGATSGFAIDGDLLRVEALGYRPYALGDIRLRPGQEMNLGVLRLESMPVVRVTVIDAVTKEPVSGAAVRLVPVKEEAEPEFMQRRISFDVEIGDDGQGDSHMSFSDGSQSLASGHTDADGVCVLNSSPGERVQIEVKDPGYAPHQSAAITLPLGQDCEQLLALEEGSTVEIQVLDADGNALAGIDVLHRAPGGDGASDGPAMMMMGGGPRPEVSDSEGKIYFENLEQGLHRFRLSEDPFAGGMGGLRMTMGGASAEEEDWSELAVVPGAELTLVLRASPRGSLDGVITEGGVALAGATLKLLPEKSEGPMMPGMMGGGPRVTTDSKGRYLFESLPADTYGLSISHASRHMPWRETVRVTERGSERDIDLPVAVLEGRITNPEGEPLSGLRVSAQEAQEQTGGPRMQFVSITMDGGGSAVSFGPGEGNTASRTDEDGYYILRGVLVDTPLVVKAEGAGYAPAESESMELGPDEVRRDVDLRLRQAGEIEVSLVRPDGSPTGGFLLRASYTGTLEPKPEPKTSFIGPNGQAQLTGCLTGSWELRLTPMGMGQGEVPSAPEPREVVVEAGEVHTVEFTTD